MAAEPDAARPRLPSPRLLIKPGSSVWPLLWGPTRSAVGAILPKCRTFGAEEFEGGMASKSGCEGDAAVGYRKVEAMVIGDRSDEGIAVERQGSHAERRFPDRGRQGSWDEHPRSREKLLRTFIQVVLPAGEIDLGVNVIGLQEEPALAFRAQIELRGVDDTIRPRCDALDRDREAPCPRSRCGRGDEGQVDAQRREEFRASPTRAAHDRLRGDSFLSGQTHAGYPAAAHDELADFHTRDKSCATRGSSLHKRLRCLATTDVSLLGEERNLGVRGDRHVRLKSLCAGGCDGLSPVSPRLEPVHPCGEFLTRLR